MTEPEQEMQEQRENLAGKSGAAATPGHQGGPLPPSDAPEPEDASARQSGDAASSVPHKVEPRAGRDS
jgi:hypothetical protein